MFKPVLLVGLVAATVIGNQSSATQTVALDYQDSVTIQIRVEDTAQYLYTGVLQGFEGYSDTFYVPSPSSGPTIAHGLDIGTIGAKNVRTLFRGIFDEDQIEDLCRASGRRGQRAESWVLANKKYKLTDEQVHLVTNRVYKLFMCSLLDAYPHLDTVNAGIRTAVLSYYMHFGNVRALRGFLLRCDYIALAAFLRDRSRMCALFSRRRAAEARLVSMTVDPMQVDTSYD